MAPALVVADALRAQGAEVLFIGGDRAELTLVPAAGYPLEQIEVAGLDRRNPLRAARAIWLAARALAQRGPVAGASDVQDAEARAVKARERRLVQRPRPQRSAEHQHQALPWLDPELRACRLAVGEGRRGRPARDAVAAPGAPFDREGEADRSGERRERAVGQTKVAVGLGEDDRDAPRQRRQCDRTRDVAAAAHHDIDARRPQQRPRA